MSKINGLLYTIEASTLLSGQTIQIVAEDEYFKQFKETWRVKNLIDKLGLDKNVDVESEAFLLEAAQKIQFIPHRTDRRKRRMSFSDPIILERPKSADRQRQNSKSDNELGSGKKAGKVVRRFQPMSPSGEKKDQEDGDITNIISALELKGLLDADNDDAVVEKDRYVAIGGPNADPKSNCIAFTVRASSILKPHLIILQENKALKKTELEHSTVCILDGT